MLLYRDPKYWVWEFVCDLFSKFVETKKVVTLKNYDLLLGCGKRGIRTPGPLTVNGFQDRRIRPLCQLSGGKSTYFLQFYK